MHAVSDTSAISALVLIGRLNLLKQQFESVACPTVVWEELMKLREHAARAALEAAVNDGWLQVVAAEDRSTITLLSRTLDAGEAEAIALAQSAESQSILIIDELAGRSVARSLGIRVVGTLGILLRAKAEGTIDSLSLEMEKLKSEAGFFMSRAIQEQMLKEAGEV